MTLISQPCVQATMRNLVLSLLVVAAAALLSLSLFATGVCGERTRVAGTGYARRSAVLMYVDGDDEHVPSLMSQRSFVDDENDADVLAYEQEITSGRTATTTMVQADKHSGGDSDGDSGGGDSGGGGDNDDDDASAVLLKRTSASALSSSSPPWRFAVRFHTDVALGDGSFTVLVDHSLAPHGVERLAALVEADFFNDAPVFRVVPRFVAQFGAPTSDVHRRRWPEIAADVRRASNRRGTLAFATLGSDQRTRTTQLFINLADNTSLDADGFAPLGRVVHGIDVVEHLYSGYGEHANRQRKMLAHGAAWMHRDLPKLNWIRRAELVDGLLEAPSHLNGHDDRDRSR